LPLIGRLHFPGSDLNSSSSIEEALSFPSAANRFLSYNYITSHFLFFFCSCPHTATGCFLQADQRLRWFCEVFSTSVTGLATFADRHSSTAKPTAALIPYRSIAAISSSSAKPASAAVTPHNVPGNPGTPPPMSVTGKERREVPLPSQEGKKGVMQYALYVCDSLLFNPGPIAAFWATGCVANMKEDNPADLEL
jgi:hypothetical protein